MQDAEPRITGNGATDQITTPVTDNQAEAALHFDLQSLVAEAKKRGYVDLTKTNFESAQQFHDFLTSFRRDQLSLQSRFPIIAANQPDGRIHVFMLTTDGLESNHTLLRSKIGIPSDKDIVWVSALEDLKEGQPEGYGPHMILTDITVGDKKVNKNLALGISTTMRDDRGRILDSSLTSAGARQLQQIFRRTTGVTFSRMG